MMARSLARETSRAIARESSRAKVRVRVTPLLLVGVLYVRAPHVTERAIYIEHWLGPAVPQQLVLLWREPLAASFL